MQLTSEITPAVEAATSGTLTIKIKGVPTEVPCVRFGSKVFTVEGRWLRWARVVDEDLSEGPVAQDPAKLVEALRKAPSAPDMLTFFERPPVAEAKYPYFWEWDNYAAIPLSTYDEWWNNRLPQESRRNVRVAAKKGIQVRTVPFSKDFARGIQEIYNETPIRQGRPFWHYGKPLEVVEEENGTFLSRSDFIGAYLGEEMAGFIKLSYVDGLAFTIQILAKNAHHDKRVVNALLAHAVQVCVEKGCTHLIYAKYNYGKKSGSTLTEFKRRNGFEELKFPRYYVPLSAKGRAVLALRLHGGLANALPAPLLDFMLAARKRFYSLVAARKTAPAQQ